MIPLSACIITYNEEDKIRNCLESISWVDEIVVVDSHSTDRTREIVSEYTQHIQQRPFRGYVDQANFAVSQANHAWVLCIDADERVSPELKTEIQHVLETEPPEKGFALPRLTMYMGKRIRHCGWFPNHKMRLFNRHYGRIGGQEPHYHAVVDGLTRNLRKGYLLHDSYKDLGSHIRQIDVLTGFASGQMFARGKRAGLFDLFIRPLWKFVKMYVIQLGVLDGTQGLMVCVSGAYYVFMKYAKLWELQRGGP